MTLSFPNIFSAFRSVAGVSRALYWGDGLPRERPTPWPAPPVRSEHRGTTCGRAPLAS